MFSFRLPSLFFSSMIEINHSINNFIIIYIICIITTTSII